MDNIIPPVQTRSTFDFDDELIWNDTWFEFGKNRIKFVGANDQCTKENKKCRGLHKLQVERKREGRKERETEG